MSWYTKTMKRLKVFGGVYSKVDWPDFEKFKSRVWFVTSKGYVVASIKGRLVYLHRLILRPSKGKMTDHKNGDRLDNRRVNLRAVTPAVNARNRHDVPTSGKIGVSRFKDKWRARIKVDYKSIHLGLFDKKEDAIKARHQAELLHY